MPTPIATPAAVQLAFINLKVGFPTPTPGEFAEVLRSAEVQHAFVVLPLNITPEVAAYVLNPDNHLNLHNRGVSGANRTRLRKAIAGGEYHMTHQGIAFGYDASGHLELADGQHRLMELLNNHTTLPFMVTIGLPSDARTAVDGGKARSIADHNLNTFAALGLTTLAGKRFTKLIGKAAGGSDRLAEHEYTAAMYQHIKQFQLIDAQVEHKRNFIAPVLAAPFLGLIAGVREETVRAFVDAVINGNHGNDGGLKLMSELALTGRWRTAGLGLDKLTGNPYYRAVTNVCMNALKWYAEGDTRKISYGKKKLFTGTLPENMPYPLLGSTVDE